MKERTMRRPLLATVMPVMLLAVVWSSERGGEAGSLSRQYDPKRDTQADIDLALRRARQDGRRILLQVGGEWCVWCRRLDTLFATRADLSGFLHRNFVVVKVNYSKENKNEAVLSRYPKIPGYPHLFVLGSDGKLLHSQDTGALESGKGHDPDKVLAFLERWAPAGKK
jgi:thioredoxin-related protein